jgi:DNA (cytosine-5)-methyltransferase 1
MKHGSLFSGLGGFDLAAEWMGWENIFHCEWMEFPRKVLDYHFPNADSHIDICKTDFKKYANKIDILTGGFPCQPFSMAGKRKGTDDERYLWGEMLRAIQEIKPAFVIAENVAGILSIDDGLVFEQVCLDLENEGYEVQPFVIPAAAKNAPHRRDRVWFVATHTDGNGLNERHGNYEKHSSEGRVNALGNFKQSYVDGNATNTKSTRSERQCIKEQREIQSNRRDSRTIPTNFQEFPTQPPICGGDDGLPTELDGITFPKWRAESIKGYGNAIVPQVALEIFKQLEKIYLELYHVYSGC